jgi:hypothetical protein
MDVSYAHNMFMKSTTGVNAIKLFVFVSPVQSNKALIGAFQSGPLLGACILTHEAEGKTPYGQCL